MLSPGRIFLLVSCWLLLPTLLAAQQDIVVMSTSSSDAAVYQTADGPVQRVFAGLRLSASGKLDVAPGGKVKLVADGKKVSLTGPDKVVLSQVGQRAEKSENTTFVGRFFNFISSSVTNTATTKDVTNYHRRYLTNTKAGTAGYTDGEQTIVLPLYLSGTMGDLMLDLKWTGPDSATVYRVSLLNAKDLTVVLDARVRDRRMQLSLADLALDAGQYYQISVTGVQGDKTFTSLPVDFLYVPDGLSKLTEILMNKRAYDLLEPDERPLYLLQAFEENGYLAATRSEYERLVRGEPGNRFYRQLYGAFLARMNDLAAAREVLRHEEGFTEDNRF